MCVKSHRHLCLQTLLIIVLVVCLLVFSAIVVFDLGIFLLTASATKVVQSDSTSVVSPSPTSALIDSRLLVDPSTNATIGIPAALVDDKVDVDNDEEDKDVADMVLDHFLDRRGQCAFLNITVQSGTLLQICDSKTDLFSDDQQLVQCFRTTLLYTGLAALLPTFLVLLSTIAVCRLLLCPILTLALVYILLAIALVVSAILFNSGAIVSNLDTEEGYPALFITALSLIVLYTVLSLLHLLLFALVTCEQRRMRGNDAEKIMKGSTDDEDDIDDPKAPLYENGFSPQKKTDFEEKIKDLKYIDDDMSYIFRKG